ncbi:LysR family transcriptional regulator [Sorangium sp. So ce296]|uniref:LysR family transcriptional regulator n=1 Tax=Sorangium sp. So ce296 TaxID=3133296 RepID=UPI003F641166
MRASLIIPQVNLSAIDVNLVIALDALLQERSVTHAARRVGLSQPAMSHALTRLRELFSDPLLVRVGRQMALTSRAEAMTPQVAAIMHDLASLFGGTRPPFEPRESERTFRIATTAYVELLLLPQLNEVLAESGPRLALHLLPLDARAADALRNGEIDLAIGAFPEGALPPDVRRAALFDDRFAGLARASHPRARGRVDLQTYAALGHAVVPRQGADDGGADDLIAARGVARREVIAVPHVFLLPHVVTSSDLVATVATRLGRAFSSLMPLRTFDLPFELPPIEIAMAWNGRTEDDPARAWLRGVVTAAVPQMREATRRKRV